MKNHNTYIIEDKILYSFSKNDLYKLIKDRERIYLNDRLLYAQNLYKKQKRYWNMITAEIKNKYIKSTWDFKKYIYYHCTNRNKSECTQKHINIENLEIQIVSILNKLEIIPELKDFVLKLLKNNYTWEVEKRLKKLENINSLILREEINWFIIRGNHR